MKIKSSLVAFTGAVVTALMSGCISSSSPPAPEKNTTVIVPQGSTAVCANGTSPPCN